MESQSNYSGPTRQSPTGNCKSLKGTQPRSLKFSPSRLETIRSQHKLSARTPDVILMALSIFDGRVLSISRRVEETNDE